MSVDPKKFGITSSLIETVKEALKGSQHKIDVAEPKGKITGADFKKLRGEDADPVVQKNLDKVNSVASDLKKMASEPIKPMGSKTSSTTSLPKATFSLKPPMGEGAKPDFLDLDKDGNKKEPMKHAAKHAKEEVEQVDELSDKTIQSYREKSHRDPKPREKGRAMAFAKQTGIGAKIKATKEEVEQVDELSKSTLGSYVKKASDSASTHTGAAAAYGSSSKSPDPKKMAQHQAVATKRATGVAKAVGKLTKEEAEVEMTEAESHAAKQIAARKDAMKTHLQNKIAKKQMSAMQAKANQRLKNINASNDKCSCGDTNESKMKCEMHGGKDAKMGREKIEVNPPLREAEDLPKKVVTKGHEIAKSLIKNKASVREPYAVGMAQAKKSAGIKD
jgi:hypothetical protein